MTSTISKFPIFSVLDEELVKRIRLAVVFGSNGNEAIFITEGDEAFGLGTNKYGCLGLADTTDCSQPKKIHALSGIGIKTLVNGSGYNNYGFHVFALTKSGRLFSWGLNDYYQLGNETTTNPGLPAEVSNLAGHHVDQVACGYSHSLALTSDGEVFAWGLNEHGEIGSGSKTNQSIPLKIIAGIGSRKVVQIACCLYSSIALLDNGELYTWGYNYFGELGLGNNNNLSVPTRVDSLAGVDIRQVVGGSWHMLALTADGVIYAWGYNYSGQVGTRNTADQKTPVKVGPVDVKFVEVAASHYNDMSVAVSDDRRTWVWGQYKDKKKLQPELVSVNSVEEVFASLGVTYRSLTIVVSPAKINKTRAHDRLAAAFNDPTTSDLKILVEGRAIHVHKSMLKIQSEHFKAMFDGDWKESKKDEIELNTYSYPVYHAFLKYLYTGQVDLQPDQAINLLDLANSYFEDDLKKICDQIIRRDISVANVLIVYAAAIKYEAKELEDFCFKFILDHLTTVVKSDAFKKLDAECARNLVIKAADHNVFKT